MIFFFLIGGDFFTHIKPKRTKYCTVCATHSLFKWALAQFSPLLCLSNLLTTEISRITTFFLFLTTWQLLLFLTPLPSSTFTFFVKSYICYIISLISDDLKFFLSLQCFLLALLVALVIRALLQPYFPLICLIIFSKPLCKMKGIMYTVLKQ